MQTSHGSFDPLGSGAAPSPHQAGPQSHADASHSNLKELISGSNPLVAAANVLLNLVPQIRSMVANQDPLGLQQVLLENIRLFEQQAGSLGISMETIIGARYCLCTVIDEAAAQTPWGGSGVWPKYSLLVALHNETWGGEKFFQLLSKLVQTPRQHIDLIELMYFAMALGFEGRYRVIDNGASQLETLKARLLQLIESTRGERSGALSVRWRGLERKAAQPWTLVPLWVTAALVLLLAFGVFVWYSYRLASQSDELFASINGIRMPKLHAAPVLTVVKPRLRQFLEPEIREGLVEVIDEAERSTIILRGDGLFDPASVEVKPRYIRVLERVAIALDEVQGKVVINGYTDNVPIRTARFPSNWHLSLARAQSVSAMVAERLKAPGRLHVEGRAESDPVDSNATPEGRARNRRVEVILMVAPKVRDLDLAASLAPNEEVIAPAGGRP
jgi:type VI secretion system protein ImpK